MSPSLWTSPARLRPPALHRAPGGAGRRARARVASRESEKCESTHTHTNPEKNAPSRERGLSERVDFLFHTRVNPVSDQTTTKNGEYTLSAPRATPVYIVVIRHNVLVKDLPQLPFVFLRQQVVPMLVESMMLHQLLVRGERKRSAHFLKLLTPRSWQRSLMVVLLAQF